MSSIYIIIIFIVIMLIFLPKLYTPTGSCPFGTPKEKENNPQQNSNDKIIKIFNNMNIPLTLQMSDFGGSIIKEDQIAAYSDNYIKVPPGLKIKYRFLGNNGIIGDYEGNGRERELFLGQVIVKKQYMATSYWPIKDMPEIRIHNLTGVPLSFNGHIVAPPREMTVYSGREQSGIAAGMELYNDEGIFDKFQIKRPITDIYYGIISNHIMPVYTYRHMII